MRARAPADGKEREVMILIHSSDQPQAAAAAAAAAAVTATVTAAVTAVAALFFASCTERILLGSHCIFNFFLPLLSGELNKKFLESPLVNQKEFLKRREYERSFFFDLIKCS